MKNLFLLLLILINFSAINAQSTDLVKQYTNHEKGIALEGYDPVSYFQEKPIKGKKDIQETYKGITYFFSNAKNKATFNNTPEKYIPEYGGWCAYAMAYSGEKVPVDPETYKIIDGKLYLFYNAYFNNTLKKWNKNEGKYLKEANQNWKNNLKKWGNE